MRIEHCEAQTFQKSFCTHKITPIFGSFMHIFTIIYKLVSSHEWFVRNQTTVHILRELMVRIFCKKAFFEEITPGNWGCRGISCTEPVTYWHCIIIIVLFRLSSFVIQIFSHFHCQLMRKSVRYCSTLNPLDVLIILKGKYLSIILLRKIVWNSDSSTSVLEHY